MRSVRNLRIVRKVSCTAVSFIYLTSVLAQYDNVASGAYAAQCVHREDIIPCQQYRAILNRST